jgi:DNA end-binding protein Ku
MPSIVWKGHLTFGLVSIPVKLYRAARRERVRLHYLHRPEVVEPSPDAPVVNPVDLATRASGQRSQDLEALQPRTEPEPVSAPLAPISRVRQALISSTEEQPIQRAEALKGYEVEPDRYVVFDQEELKGSTTQVLAEYGDCQIRAVVGNRSRVLRNVILCGP